MTFPCATAGHRIFTPEGSCSLPCGEGCSRETQKNLKKTGPAGCLSPPGLRTLDKFLNRCAQNHKIPTGRGSVLSVTSFTPSSEASAAALSSDFPGLVSPSANPLISSVSERGPLSSCNREWSVSLEPEASLLLPYRKLSSVFLRLALRRQSCLV